VDCWAKWHNALRKNNYTLTVEAMLSKDTRRGKMFLNISTSAFSRFLESFCEKNCDNSRIVRDILTISTALRS
jgi:hypothetical protein